VGVTTEETAEQALRQRARKRVDDLMGFYSHLVAYLLVNGGLWVLDIATGGGVDWAYWPTIGWGIGLALHATTTFLTYGVLTDSWRARKEAEYMARMRGTPNEID
jgi:2TM domain